MTNFYELCESTLSKLLEAIELKDKHSNLDAEYSDGILNIKIDETNQTFVINRHSASQKIWYSSPISGADYFSYDNNLAKWINSKQEVLEEKLLKELLPFLN